MNKIMIAVALASFAVSPVQAMYKCTVNGKIVFSDVQCAKDAEKIEVKTTKNSEEGKSRGAELCAQNVFKMIAFKDQESVKLGEFKLFTSSTWPIGSYSVPSNVWLADVNAKNSYGGYTGNKKVLCITDIGNMKVMHMEADWP